MRGAALTMGACQIRLQADALVIVEGVYHKVLSRDEAGVTLRTLGARPVTVTKTHAELADLYAGARELDLDAVVEISRDDELEVALELDADVIGINNRDLEDFTVDITRTFDLLADVPAGKTVVSESGIVYREQIEELERVGVDAVLVGETLMRAEEPEAAVRALIGGKDA